MANSPEHTPAEAAEDDKNPFLVALGERVRDARARRGLTRKAVAAAAEVSERHLANLEYGIGNASILVLQQVAGALHCPLAELIGDVTTQTPEWLSLRALLAGRSDDELRRARLAIADLLGAEGEDPSRRGRIALVGLRGAGKSTLGRRLADDLGVPFIELSREIERLAGCSTSEVHALYGANAYRRYERRALEEAVDGHAQAVIATPGGLVADVAAFDLLLARCYTVWLQASPEDHMRRVAEQGDLRPMAASREAMDDLRRILAGRAAFYSRADLAVDTSAQSLDATFALLRTRVRQARHQPA
ncbi:MAG TPA: helix-turn-helix transcriptional regulator [Casimicrobiaceae bacterium]|nr:helix-turn-helix transcriptional regulator [Casimicrobiaceae bacterium]